MGSKLQFQTKEEHEQRAERPAREVDGQFRPPPQKRIRRQMFFPVAICYMELVLRLWDSGRFWGSGLIYIILFSVGAGLVINFVISLFPLRVGRVLNLVFLSGITLLFLVQTVFYSIFRTYLEVEAVGMAGMVLADFYAETVRGIGRSILPVLFLLIPLILLCVTGRWKRQPIRPNEKKWTALAAVLLHVLVIGSILLNNTGTLSLRAIYQERFVLPLAIQNFGMLTGTRLDVQYSLFGRPEGDIAGAMEILGITDEEEPEPIEEDNEPEPPENGDNGEEYEPIEIEEPVVFGYNILDIDFEALLETETRESVREMHLFFSSREGSRQNEFTGMFEGKNLIWIIGEAFHGIAIHPEVTPTLYQISQEGFIFPNFYTPDTGFSTTGGEFGTLLGLIPTHRLAFQETANRYMPFAFGNLFRDQGYATFAFHNHNHTFNGRNLTHPNLGYDFRAIGRGLDIARVWPASDLEMIQVTVGEFINEPQFHVYYLTVSGHLEYNFFGNAMAMRHQDAVADLPYSTAARAYLATQMELDLAIRYLIDALEEAGRLEETVIVLSGDHYPYGLRNRQDMEDLRGAPFEHPEFDVHRSPLIIWNAAMEEPVVVESFCSFYDVMPTLANLFALPFDSRLVMGVDLLSDSVPLVQFARRHWISQYGRFNAHTRAFTPHPWIDEGQVPENHVEQMQARATLEERFSGRIIAYDYYRIVLGG